MNKAVKRTERGWGGHFICADRCLFRRNTLLECGNDRIVVSTVGSMMNRKTGKIETIGHNRYYETMAFKAEFDNPYYEVNVSEQIYFDSEWAICGNDASELPNDVDNKADEMHEAVVAELTEKLMSKVPA